jgi:uncharacterized protein (DUF58 family)
MSLRETVGPLVPVPTDRAAVAVLAAATLVAVVPVDPPASVLVAAATMLVAVVVDAVLAGSPDRIVVHRELPPVVTLGQSATVRWRIENPGARRVRVSIADDLAPSLHPRPRRSTVTVPARGTARVDGAITPQRRGRFEVAELVVRVRGPLGLVVRQGARQRPVTLRVYPRFRSRAEAELRIDRARILEVGLRSAKGRGAGTEFDQLRDWTEDDEFRRIDWSATARSGRPIVRTYRAERNQTLICLLDNGRTMAGRVADAPRVEYAMDAVMTLATVAGRLGDRCGLVAFDREVRAVVGPAGRATQLSRITEAMFDLDPVLVESDYRGAFTTTVARFRRRALLVVLTDLVEQAVAETLLPALPIVTRNHLVLVGAVTDPEVVDWAESPAEDAEAVYRRAAAIGALEERRRTVRRLRAAGATVVDCPPDRLSAELADAYLRIKATSRL